MSWKLLDLSMVGVEGTSSGAVKCVDIGKTINGEGTLNFQKDSRYVKPW